MKEGLGGKGEERRSDYRGGQYGCFIHGTSWEKKVWWCVTKKNFEPFVK